MKRSEINQLITQSIALLQKYHITLPPFAYWSKDQWATKWEEYNEIRDNMLGWDLTDFGSGDFDTCGLFLFTLRNGNLANTAYPKA